MKQSLLISGLLAALLMTGCTDSKVTSPTLDEVVKFY